MKLSRGPGGIGGELCDGSWTESKIEPSARCLVAIQGNLSDIHPDPKMARGVNGEGGGGGQGREEGGEFFSELERKFAQLNGARCLPLVPLIVVESTTRAESRNKGNTSRAFLHRLPPCALFRGMRPPVPRVLRGIDLSTKPPFIFSSSFLLVALWRMYIFYIIWLGGRITPRADISPLPPINGDYIDYGRNCIWSIVDLLGAFPRHLRRILIAGNCGEISGG